MASPDSNTVNRSADSLLALIKDIHPAAPADWWPPAPGWWLLTFLVLLLLWWLGRWMISAWRRFKFKRMVTAMLTTLFREPSVSPRQLLVELNQLLKRWLSSQGNNSVQYLTGPAWAEYLLTTSKEISAKEKIAIEVLASGHYQNKVPEYEPKILQNWAERWLNWQEKSNG